MKPKHLPRLWCALQGVLPLETWPALAPGRMRAVRPRADHTVPAPRAAGGSSAAGTGKSP